MNTNQYHTTQCKLPRGTDTAVAPLLPRCCCRHATLALATCGRKDEIFHDGQPMVSPSAEIVATKPSSLSTASRASMLGLPSHPGPCCDRRRPCPTFCLFRICLRSALLPESDSGSPTRASYGVVGVDQLEQRADRVYPELPTHSDAQLLESTMTSGNLLEIHFLRVPLPAPSTAGA